MISTFLSVILSAPALFQVSQSPPARPPAGPAVSSRSSVGDGSVASRKAIWAEPIASLFRDVKGSVFIDIPDADIPIRSKLKAETGLQTLERLAILWRRDLLVLDSGAMLVRQNDALDDTSSSTRESMLKSVNSLDDATLKKLISNGVLLSELPQDLKMMLAGNARIAEGLAEQILQGDPVTVKLFENPVAEWKDASGRTRTASVGNHFERSPLGQTLSSSSIVRETPLPSGQEVDFRSGAVMTLWELNRRLRAELGIHFVFDSRLNNSLVFLKGKFQKQDLRKLMEIQCRPRIPTQVPWAEVRQVEEYNKFMDRIFGTFSFSEGEDYKNLSREDFENGRSILARDLAKKSTVFARRMASYALNGDEVLKLGFRAGFMISGSEPKDFDGRLYQVHYQIEP